MHAGNDNDDIQAKIVLSFLCLLHEEYKIIAITDSWWALACFCVSFLQLQTPWMDIQQLYDKIYTYLRARRLDILCLSVLFYHQHAKTNSKSKYYGASLRTFMSGPAPYVVLVEYA